MFNRVNASRLVCVGLSPFQLFDFFSYTSPLAAPLISLSHPQKRRAFPSSHPILLIFNTLLHVLLLNKRRFFFPFHISLFFFRPPQRRYMAAQRSATRNIRTTSTTRKKRLFGEHEKGEKGKEKKSEGKTHIGREDRSFSSYFLFILHWLCFFSHVWMMSFP